MTNKTENIAVLIPCLNEEKSIEKVINDFKNELPNAVIYVYDNNSDDRTFEIAKQNAQVVKIVKQKGKARVVRKMFQNIEANIYILVDGDDTYPAEEINNMLNEFIALEADMLVGDRISNLSYKKQNKRPFHTFGNKLIAKTINRIFRSNLQDIFSGYRIFSRKFVKTFPILSNEFELETEMSMHALEHELNIIEHPISYQKRTEGSNSKLHTYRDGFKIILTILNIFKDYKPFTFFSIIGTFSLILGILVGTPPILEYFKFSYVYKVPSAILATGLVLVSMIAYTLAIILSGIKREHRKSYELQVLNYSEEENEVKQKNFVETN